MPYIMKDLECHDYLWNIFNSSVALQHCIVTDDCGLQIFAFVETMSDKSDVSLMNMQHVS